MKFHSIHSAFDHWKKKSGKELIHEFTLSFWVVSRADIAVIGLAVMGQNLILNMNDHGFVVCAYNRTPEKVENFLQNEAKDTDVRSTGVFILSTALMRVDQVCKVRKVYSFYDSPENQQLFGQSVGIMINISCRQI